jgi:ABC-type uncharacterized transport system auxiliary subunit
MQRARKHLGAAVAALALPGVLTACLSQVLPEPAPPAVTYDFGPLPEQPPAALPARFRLDAVTAPSWHRRENIYYRRLDEQPAALVAYAQNRWIASPAELFAERLAYRLAQAQPDATLRELSLEVELVSFEHVYTADGLAYVVARARASYEDADGRTLERSFEARRPAVPTVDGATAQLPLAADALLDDVLDWLRTSAARDGS